MKHSTITVNPEEVFRQYRGKALWIALAVAFDAEGTIGLSKVHATLQYAPNLTLFNTEISWLEAWKGRLGRGNVYTRKVQDAEKHQVSGTWIVKKRSDAIYILKRIIPYLAIKREQAELLLSFYEDRPAKATHLGEEELSRREEIYQRLRVLNAKGNPERLYVEQAEVLDDIVRPIEPSIELDVNALVN